MCRKKSIITILILLASTIIFIYFLKKNLSIYYDEKNYYDISLDILKHGLFGISSDLRTYLYPLIIAVISIFTDGRIETIKILISILQFTVYAFTIFTIGKMSIRYSNSEKSYYIILIFGLLNPYLIQSTTLMLTDILTACFLMLSLLLLVTSDLNRFKNGLCMSSLLYCAVMIRPSSAIFLPVFLVIAVYRYYRFKDFKLPKFIISGILCLIIFIPQLYNNVHNFNDFTPLIHKKLYHEQNAWAAEYLKYATITEKNEVPQLYYYSPFHYDDKNVTLTSLILNKPYQFITVYSAHIFGLLDWGYVNTYIDNLKDKSKIIFSIFLYILWIVMIWGMIYTARDKIKLVIPFIFAVLIYTLFMGTTAIESRFGYPIYLFLLPFAGSGIEQITNHLKSKNIMRIVYVGSIFIIIIVLSLFISMLIDKQTGRINWF